MSTLPTDLMTQGAARAEAKRLHAAGLVPDGLVAIAHAVPINSWGGAEKGWTVSYIPAPGRSQ